MLEYWQFHVVQERKVVGAVKERHSPSGVVQLTRRVAVFNTQ